MTDVNELSAVTPIDELPVVDFSEHACMCLRGVATHGASMTTVAHRGAFADDRALRAEVVALLDRGER